MDKEFRFGNEEVVRIMDNIVRNGMKAKISALDAVKMTKYIDYVDERVFFGEKYASNVTDDIRKWGRILNIVLLENECIENRRSSTLEFYNLV